jgi:hypothetical protein
MSSYFERIITSCIYDFFSTSIDRIDVFALYTNISLYTYIFSSQWWNQFIKKDKITEMNCWNELLFHIYFSVYCTSQPWYTWKHSRKQWQLLTGYCVNATRQIDQLIVVFVSCHVYRLLLQLTGVQNQLKVEARTLSYKTQT